MKTFLTADWHLGDPRMEALVRPFASPEEMANEYVERHNELVGPLDVVIVVGDICFREAKDWLPWVAKFKGKKFLVRGNHDRVFTDDELRPYFIKVVPEGERLEWKTDKGTKLNVVHYPTQSVPTAFNIVGHVHGNWRVQKNMLNVGVDVHNNRPVPLSMVDYFLEQIKERYDMDVWSSIHWANIAHWNRGVGGSYYPPKDSEPRV